jgi:DNA adenine methylase
MNVKPFVKWVGGKRQLLAEITPLIPEAFTRYIEPFTGGGAVFFSLSKRLLDDHIPAWLNDINPELINAYQVVRDRPDVLLADLHTHIHSKEYFSSIRGLDRQEGGLSSLTPVQRASRFIYLNRTAFNGLYRVNAKGQFNVPFGRYKNPAIADADTIYRCSKALQKVKISCSSFDTLLPQTKEGDFIYLDPPYIPLNKTSYFTSYDQTGFRHAEQQKLADLIRDIDRRGVRFLVSNAYVPELKDFYSGFTIIEVQATRAINANKDGRHAISEALITNIL